VTDGRGFHTPDYDGNARDEFMTLSLPSYLFRFVYGALGELTEKRNWYQVGDMTPEDMVAVFSDILDSDANIMVGQIAAFPSEAAVPPNCLICNGQAFAQDDFPMLYGILGTNILPDLRSVFLLGTGNGRIAGEIGGEESHTLTTDEIPPHSHEYSSAVGSVATVVVPDAPSAVPSPSLTSPVGGGVAHTNMPPFYVIVYAIIAR
jgi:microcystin-dependent protein